VGGGNVPPDTAPRAYKGWLCSSRVKDEDGVPVGQSTARLGLVVESLEKFVNGLSHGNWGEFTGIVCRSPDTAELEITSSAAGAHTVKGSHFQA